jgi:Tfp pilus assembly protein FimT
MIKSFKKNQKGGLLVEVLGVLGIFLLIASISIPYIRKYQPNLKLNGVAKELVSDLRYAQQLTVTEQIIHMVQIDLIDNKYEILKLDTATTTIKSVDVDSEIFFSEVNGLSDNQVYFNSYGAVREAGDITLININGKTAFIEIKPSGHIKLN